MRTWPGYESREGVYDHVIRYLPRDYAIFRRMKPGDQYPEGHLLALKMLDEEVQRRLGARTSSAAREALRRKLRDSIVPPYDAGKFPNKWPKMYEPCISTDRERGAATDGEGDCGRAEEGGTRWRMTSKLALKKLTPSDLTLFEHQYRALNATKQKAINLNADVLVENLYPALEAATYATNGRLPIDLWVYGPGAKAGLNLQRKIIKSHKSWRLDGELIVNPPEEPNRFNSLVRDDYVFLRFEGDIVPTSATAVFVAKALPEDKRLHTVCDMFGLTSRDTMVALDDAMIADVVAWAGLPDDHPLASLALTDELQEAALGSAPATERLLRTGRARRLSAIELRRARDAAEAVGRLGKELVALHLERQKKSGAVADFEWVSEGNAVAPLDFRVSKPDERLDVKTTSGPFEREFHASLSELKEMAAGTEPYRIYRVYEATASGAQLRCSEPMQALAAAILKSLGALPAIVTVDAVSISPTGIKFGPRIALEPAEENVEASDLAPLIED